MATKPVKPLDSIRVVDLTGGGSGPFGTMMITDLGAEVIRIDDVQRPDFNTRGAVQLPIDAMAGAMGAHYPDRLPGARPYERFSRFSYFGRGRKSATFALGDPKTFDLLLKLIDVSDVLISNHAPGWLGRKGLSPQALMTRNPRLIVVEMTGFGATPAPYRDYRAYGANMEAVAGHTSLRGYPDLDMSNTTNIVHGDAVGGAAGLFAVACALVQRERTGRGDYVDLSQTEAFIPQLAPALADFALNGRVHTASGNRDPVAVQGVYRCLGDDDWLAVTVSTDEEWESLCRVVNRADLIGDPRYVDRQSRHLHHDEIDELIGKWCVELDHYEAFHLLQAGGVSAGPVLNMKEAFREPQLRERGFFESWEYPRTGPTIDGVDTQGTHEYPGPLFEFSETPLRMLGPAPTLGQHNEYVFKTLLGLSQEEFQNLVDEGLIGTSYPAPTPIVQPRRS